MSYQRRQPMASHSTFFKNRKTILAGIGVSGVLLSLLFTNAATSTAVSGSCNLPADTSVKIGRAQIFTQNIADRSVLAKTQFIWGDSGTTKVAGTYNSFYIPATRELSRPCAFGANVNNTAEYLKSSCYSSGVSQTWVLWAKKYSEPDGVLTSEYSPKVYFSYKGLYGPNLTLNDSFIYPPLDFSNLNVQDYIYDTYLRPKVGRYDAFALDNASAYNLQDRPSSGRDPNVRYTGPAVGIMGGNGQLVPPAGHGQKVRLGKTTSSVYSGDETDANYRADFVDYMSRMTQKAHTASTPTCVVANNKYRNSDPEGTAGFLDVANAVDISLDETGFTTHSTDAVNCNPVPVHLNLPSTASKPDQNYWSKRMIALQKIAQNVNGPKGLVIVDKTCYKQSQLRFSYFEWPLANFMMIKGNNSYLSLGAVTIDSGESNFISEVQNSPTDSTMKSLDLIFLLNTGSSARTNLVEGGVMNAPVYYRQFSKALAVVNPNSSGAASYTLPTLAPGYQYQGLFDDIKYANGATINLDPKKAKVFVKVAVP